LENDVGRPKKKSEKTLTGIKGQKRKCPMCMGAKETTHQIANQRVNDIKIKRALGHKRFYTKTCERCNGSGEVDD